MDLRVHALVAAILFGDPYTYYCDCIGFASFGFQVYCDLFHTVCCRYAWKKYANVTNFGGPKSRVDHVMAYLSDDRILIHGGASE